MKTPMMTTGQEYNAIGDLKFSKKVESLVELEKYFIDECQRRKVFWSYDVTAIESLYFDTINYTTYAGCFMMHPLQPEMAQRQVYDALRDNNPTTDFVSYFKNKIKQKSANKYIKESVVEIQKKYDAVVVLPGDNKLKSNVCLRKLHNIANKHGDKVLFKPHPLTHKETLDKLQEQINVPVDFAFLNSDLYEILPKVKIVYSSHLSESAMYATVLNKEVEPIDQYGKRQPASFAHINYFLFNELDPLSVVNTMLSSHKSGIVCPEIEPNWKEKIDAYLDYILALREKIKNHYVQ